VSANSICQLNICLSLVCLIHINISSNGIHIRMFKQIHKLITWVPYSHALVEFEHLFVLIRSFDLEQEFLQLRIVL